MASGRLAAPSPTLSTRHHTRHSMPDPSQVLSGSETEREGDSAVFHSTSSSGSKSRSSDSARLRLSSAPTSPHKARQSTYSPTRRRKRASMASMNAFLDRHSDDDNSDDDNNSINNNDTSNNDHHEYQHRRDGDRYEVGTARDRLRDRHDTLRDDRASTTRAATVNLNSIKKNPTTNNSRRRSALPREFREGSTDEYSNHTNAAADNLSPQTPYRPPHLTAAASTSTSTMTTTTLSRRSTTLRSTTRGLSDDYRNSPTYSLRDLPSNNTRTRHNNSLSTSTPPVSAPSSKTAHTFDSSPTITRSNTIGRQTRERRQTLRGGSAESALGMSTGGGRSLVGEGLRAAGLSRRTDRERERTMSESTTDTRGSGSNDRASLASSGSGNGDVFRERRVDWSPNSSTMPSASAARQRRTTALDELGVRTVPPRASTSMADYSYTSRSRHQIQSDEEDDDNDDERQSRALRGYKSAYPVLASREASLTRREQFLIERERELGRRERDLERAGSALGRHSGVPVTPAPTPSPYTALRDRYTSPFGSTRRTTHQQTPGGGQQQQQQQQQQQPSEHARLMVESLSMFESQLSKLAPSLGQGPNHAEMLSRNAQALVLSADRLNGMLRTGNSRALDAQIEAEVEGECSVPGSAGGTGTSNGANVGAGSSGPSHSLVDVWRKIGGDYREGLRVSDELVRAVTGLLLGVGRVMKEYVHLGTEGGAATTVGMGRNVVVGGSPSMHARSISLGEEDVRGRGSLSPDFAGAGTASTGSGGGGSSVLREPRRSWEPGTSSASGGGSSNASVSAGAGSREEALRRLAGVRSDSPLARSSPAFHAVRELDRLETASPAMGGGLGMPKVNIPGARRLFAPSQQREMALVASSSSTPAVDNGIVSTAQLDDPSPTPISRTRVFDRAELGYVAAGTQASAMGEGRLPASQSATTMPLETPLRRNVTISGGGVDSMRDRHERRKVSVTSITTIRASAHNGACSTASSSSVSGVGGGGPTVFSALTTPSGATTAITLDGAIGMTRTDSGSGTGGDGGGGLASTHTGSGSVYSNLGARPTFSRPEGMTSVATGLQQKLEGYRRRSDSESVVAEGAPGVGATRNGGDVGGRRRGGLGVSSLITPEVERRKTIAARGGAARMSLDSAGVGVDGRDGGAGSGSVRRVVDLSVNAADRSAAVTVGVGRKERRRTVTDIWPGAS